MTTTIGIDVGGTTIKGARVADGIVLATGSVPTPTDSSSLTEAVIGLVDDLRDDTTCCVGVVSPGVLDDGVVRFAANLPWRDEPVRDLVTAAVGLPVTVGRDVAAAALAECADRADPDADALFVALGTGIACAHVIGGRVHEGATGRAGEFGHVPVRPDGAACPCGQRGCLERYASAAALERGYTERTGRTRTAAQLATRLPDDDAARAVWDDAVDALACALATQVLVTDPARIVIGGGLTEAGKLLLGPLRAALADRLAWRPAPPVDAARLGGRAGVLGAAMLAGSAATSRAIALEPA